MIVHTVLVFVGYRGSEDSLQDVANCVMGKCSISRTYTRNLQLQAWLITMFFLSLRTIAGRQAVI